MTDLRARLADALRQHWIRAAPGRGCCCGSTEAQPYHLADVLLSLPGIAIVELPEPVRGAMTDDIIERAEAALADDPYVPLFETEPISPALRVLIPELLAALKAARAEAAGGAK